MKKKLFVCMLSLNIFYGNVLLGAAKEKLAGDPSAVESLQVLSLRSLWKESPKEALRVASFDDTHFCVLRILDGDQPWKVCGAAGKIVDITSEEQKKEHILRFAKTHSFCKKYRKDLPEDLPELCHLRRGLDFIYFSEDSEAQMRERNLLKKYRSIFVQQIRPGFYFFQITYENGMSSGQSFVSSSTYTGEDSMSGGKESVLVKLALGMPNRSPILVLKDEDVTLEEKKILIINMYQNLYGYHKFFSRELVVVLLDLLPCIRTDSDTLFYAVGIVNSFRCRGQGGSKLDFLTEEHKRILLEISEDESQAEYLRKQASGILQ